MATDYVLGLRLPFYFWLGLRGFVGALLWLILPVGLLLMATKLPAVAAALLTLPALLLLLIVAIHLPFLQAHFAHSGRFTAMFEWREVRARFRRAPLAFWLALLVFAFVNFLLYPAILQYQAGTQAGRYADRLPPSPPVAMPAPPRPG